MKTLIVNQNIIVSIVLVMLLIYGIQGTDYVQAQNNAPELTPVKDRTQQVQDRIVALVPGVDSADDVTAAHLALITNLNLSNQSITALKAGDFDGLSTLRSLSLAKNTLTSLPADIFSGLPSISSLDLGSNTLSSLPADVFSGLSSMSRLNLSYNSLDSLSANTFSGLPALTGLDLGNNQLSSLPADIFSGLSTLNWLSLSSNQLSSLPDGLFSGLSSLNSLYLGNNTVGLSIAVSLEKVGENQFKTTTATGAPFNIVLPITVTNGSIEGGSTTVTIPAGGVESELLTVIRTPGTSDAITAVIGTLPELPTSHYGYSLDKPSSTDNTLSFALGIPKRTGDPNENHAPIFTEGSRTTRSIPENTPAGKNIGSPVTATDEDEDMLTYTLSGADAASFGIVSTTGQLQTRAPLDYEKKNTYAVTVTVYDGSATDVISVTIDVIDEEENNAPVFVEGSGAERSIPENTPAGRNIGGPVIATDEDEDVLTYSLSGADAASFGIISTTGQLRTKAPLDYEKRSSYSVAVLVSDGKGGTDTIGVAINVTDVEENNAPVFVEGSGAERSIPENTPAGRNIGGPVTAMDEDEDVLTYSLSGADAASFGIISTTGQLRTKAPLDYEKRSSYSVAVLVSDGKGGTDTIGVAINVTDVEENNAPVFVEGSGAERSIPENTPAGRNIGSPVTATDLDEEDVLTYRLSGADAASFGIVSTTGQLRTQAPLDYEKRNSYSVAVLVSDGKGGTDTIGVAINVTDVEENNAPVFVEGSGAERSIPENTPAGRNIGGPVIATDEDEDVLTYTLRGVDAASFGIVSTTGQLRTRASLDYEQRNVYSVAVLVSDGKGGTDTIGVAINITDVDETPTAHAPEFIEGSATERSIPENTPAGRNIGSPVTAMDEDEDVLTYSLSGADAVSFGIVSTTGQLKTRAPLDYEKRNTYSVAVIVSDGTLTDTIGVAINVTDVAENNAPVFVEGNGTERSIPENTPAGRNIGSPVTAMDEDEDVLTYSLSGADAASFGIISTTGQLRTKAPLDYEKRNVYSVAVLVSDGKGGTDSIGVAINVTDVDENNAPVFVEGNGTERSIPENTPAGRNIGALVSATDEDGDILTYSLSGADVASFGIVSTTGQLKTSAPLDYEQKNTYSVAVIVSDGTLTDTIGVTINVTDVPENNTPVFVEGSATERLIPENTPAGRNIGTPVTATDLDEDTLTYSLFGVDADSFGIISTTGQLKTKAPLDYEKKNVYLLAVVVSDGNDGVNITAVTINITDVNENNPPVFAENNTTRFIPENTPAGVHIGEAVVAKDADSDDTLTYTLGGTNAAAFAIDQTTGQLKTKAALDYETKNAYSVVVTASDGSSPATTKVNIIVTDVDESRAPAFAENRTTRSVKENTPAGVNIGNPVSATDADGDTLTYTLSGTDAAAFSIVRTTGQLKTRAALDYETKNAYSVIVIASDGLRDATTRVAIRVTDVDESRAPTFAGSRTRRFIKENTPAGVNIGNPVSATDADGDTLTYTLGGTDATAFSIVRTTGQLKTKAPLDFEKKNAYTVTVTVSDGGRTDAITVTIIITDVEERLADGMEGLLIYWTEDRDDTSIIRLLEVTSGQTRNIVTGLGSLPPNDLAIDPLGRKVYWSDDFLADRIQRANLDGTDRQDVVGGLSPTGISLDVSAGKIYWVRRGKIQRADLDGANVEDVVIGLDRPVDVAVDAWDGKIYWTSTRGKKIQRADLDGANVEDVITGLDSPTYIDIDMLGGKIYWVEDAWTGKIRRANLDGTDIKDVVTGFIWSIGISLDVQGRKIYWTNTQQKKIQRADLDGANVEDVITGLTINTLFPAIGVATIPPEETQAAPSLHSTSLEMLTAADVQKGLPQAQGLAVLVPKETALLPNYPNPFNPETWIPYHLARDADVTLTIYAIDGQVVRRLALGHQDAGIYQNRSRAGYWDGKNAFGEPVASGVYFYTLTAGSFTTTRKMLIRK